MSNLVERSFTDLLEKIIDNRGRTCPTATTGLPLIATNCIKDDHLYPVFENVRHVDAHTVETWFRGHPEPDDIIFVCKGTPGRVAMVPDPVSFCIAQDMVSLRPDRNQINSRYLYYVLSSPEVQAGITNMHVGSMIPHFKKGDFGKLRLRIHQDLAEQQTIAEVLGALDDKIDANTKLADTALSLAGTLYKSYLRNANLSDQTFADLASINGGGTPSTKNPDFWDGTVNWATPTDVTALTGPYLERTNRTISDAGLQNCSSKLFAPGAILMTSRATIGAFAMTQQPIAVNQGFIVVEPFDQTLRYWVLHEMMSRVDEFISMANGATFLELSKGNFKKFLVRLADPSIMHAFNDRAQELHAVARHALLENHGLAATRDVLLPQLMSARVRVAEAQATVGSLL